MSNSARRVLHLAFWLGLSFLNGQTALSQTKATAANATRSTQPWRTAYQDVDATGEHVIGFWRFDNGAEIADTSRNKLNLRLAGAVTVAEGKFGGGLESFPGWPVIDQQHSAVAASTAVLSPSGPFTVEMWIKPKPDFAKMGQCYLLDKKYVAHADYQWLIGPADSRGGRRLIVNLGFGEDSATFTSDVADFPAGEWNHIAFTYDGAGETRFFRNGESLGVVRRPGRGAIAPGRHALHIGDRVGSNYGGFPGFLDEVRICRGALDFRPASLNLVSDRTVFVRMEPDAVLNFRVENKGRQPLVGARVVFALEGVKDVVLPISELAPGASHDVAYPLDTSLRPDKYSLRARIELTGKDPYRSEDGMKVQIVARPRPHRLPVVMWGIGSPQGVTEELARLKEIGFTHCLGLGADYDRIWKAGTPVDPAAPPQIAATKKMLDRALANDLGIIASLSPGHWLGDRPAFQRIDRAGKPYPRHDLCALFPEAAPFCQNVGASIGQAYGKFPAFQAALIQSEVRDSSQICFHDHDRAAYRAASGQEIPAEVSSKNGVNGASLKGFPADRIIADDHPILKFYRWFWTVGDGWNGLHTAVHRGLHAAVKRDFWTFYDPAVRAASIAGSGGEVDVISQWTYSYPDPLRIAMPTDELFTMARLAATPQRVMKMTQVIWYRSQTAPAVKAAQGAAAPGSPWEDRDPGAQYITIAPMHMREAFWTKIARPIEGIMYHGWESLVSTDSTSSYRYTHPETQHELKRLVHDVVEPLGPMLKQVPDRPSDVAFLESFTSQMFAHRGSYGWSHQWGGDAYLILQYAHLQPEIVYEETILKHGLDRYRTLVLVDCDVLPASVAAAVKAFQSRGGIVVGDDHLAPALKADIVLQPTTRTKRGDQDKAVLLERAAALRRQLDARVKRHVDTADPEIVPRVRTAGTSDYVFVVNDHREFGNYVGQYGLVMENGLPAATEVTVQRPAGHVYDLVAGVEVPATAKAGQLRFPVHLGPCDGRVLLVTQQPIGQVAVAAPGEVRTGEALKVEIAIKSAKGDLIDAVVPVHVDVIDPAGRPAEQSGFYGAAGGRLELTLDLAKNDQPGVWIIRVRELASRKSTDQPVRVIRP